MSTLHPVITHDTILGLFVGQPRPLEPDGRMSAIVKQRVEAPVAIGPLGLQGDQQADPRVHGGPDKAVHLYPARHYTRWRTDYPRAECDFAPGLLGENISVASLTEADICLGDVWDLGEVRLRVTQPRKPCWKQDARTGIDGFAQTVSDLGTTGWYCAVDQAGTVDQQAQLALQHRPHPGFTLAALWALHTSHRPDPAELTRWLELPVLTDNWRQGLTQRRDWLLRHG